MLASVPKTDADWVAIQQIIRLHLRRWVTDEDDLADMTQNCLTKVWVTALQTMASSRNGTV